MAESGEKIVVLRMPRGGLSNRLAFGQQGLEFTHSTKNVRPFSQSDQRLRGGPRAGTVDHIGSSPGSGRIQDMNVIVQTTTDAA
jgi:hypothetical protein